MIDLGAPAPSPEYESEAEEVPSARAVLHASGSSRASPKRLLPRRGWGWRRLSSAVDAWRTCPKQRMAHGCHFEMLVRQKLSNRQLSQAAPSRHRPPLADCPSPVLRQFTQCHLVRRLPSYWRGAARTDWGTGVPRSELVSPALRHAIDTLRRGTGSRVLRAVPHTRLTFSYSLRQAQRISEGSIARSSR